MPLFQQDFKPSTPEQSGGLGAMIRSALQGYYSVPNANADLALKVANAKKANAMAELPFGGANVPGVAGQVVGLEMVKKLYGEDSPQYQDAKQAFNLEQSSTGSRINYQNRLANTLPIRYTTPAGKEIIEESNVRQGYSPAGTPMGQPVAPGQAAYLPSENGEDLANQYALRRLGKSSDADTRKRNLYATNIEKTLGFINPDDLTQYAGLFGAVKEGKQSALSSVGKESKEYDNYSNALQAVDFLTSQVRQFYGDSIQPAMIERLEKLSNPSTWKRNPKLAKELFNTTKSILGNEMNTYRQALKSPSAYQGDSANNSYNDQKPSAGASILAKQLTLPSFNTKEEYQSWFNRQPEVTKQAIRLKLKGNQNGL